MDIFVQNKAESAFLVSFSGFLQREVSCNFRLLMFICLFLNLRD